MLRERLSRALFALVVFPFATGLAAQGPPPVTPGDLLGSTGARGGSLISIDPMTGAASTRFPLGSFGPVSEIRFRGDGVLFGSTGAGNASIITIDPDTGAETLVGVHAPGAVTGLEFIGGVLYGAYFGGGGTVAEPEGGGTSLAEIDQADGSLTLIGVIDGYDPVRGLAYDTTTATLYGVGIPSRRGDSEPEGIGDELFIIDPATGDTTPIGPTSGIQIGGMTFGPDGLLYGGAASPVSDLGASIPLVTLDTATGAATLIGDTGAAAISGLAFVPVLGGGGGGGPIVAIPTASETGLLVLGALLAAAALFVLRRA